MNTLLRDAEKRVKEGSAPHHVALLALLTLAEEYLAAKDRVTGHQKEFRDKTGELFELLK